MPSFQRLFIESKGQPIIHNGQTIQMVDRLLVKNEQHLRLIFESIKAEWRQGVHLSTDGDFIVNDMTVKKAVVLWHDTAPKEVLIQVHTKKGECFVKNVWDSGNGTMDSWHNGAAMIVEDIVSGKRYRCNDGQPDDDF